MVAAATAAAIRIGWVLLGSAGVAPGGEPELDEEVQARLALIAPAIRAGWEGLGALPSEQRAARNVASHDFSTTVRGCRNFRRRQRRAEWRRKEVASTGSEADGLGTDTCRDRAVGSGIESRFLDSGSSQRTKQED